MVEAEENILVPVQEDEQPFHNEVKVTLPDFPYDYEPCSECGVDHEYEPAEAAEWHWQQRETERQRDHQRIGA